MLTSEPGQLEESINVLGLGKLDSEMYEEDAIMYFTQSDVNIKKTCERVGI